MEGQCTHLSAESPIRNEKRASSQLLLDCRRSGSNPLVRDVWMDKSAAGGALGVQVLNSAVTR
jgi:hypothetical protein